VPKETLIVKVVMDSDEDIIDEEIKIKTCDAHKTNEKNRKDAINTDQSVQIKLPSAASKDFESKRKSCQDEEMPYIQANKVKGVAIYGTGTDLYEEKVLNSI